MRIFEIVSLLITESGVLIVGGLTFVFCGKSQLSTKVRFLFVKSSMDAFKFLFL